MIQNNNKQILGKLTIRSLAFGKLRNWLILLTVALSAALLSGIALVSVHIHQEEVNRLSTAQHVLYMDVNQEQIQKLSQDPRVEDLLLYKQGAPFEKEDYLLVPQYYGDNSKIIRPPEFAEGVYPQKAHEIAVDYSYMKQLGLKPILGETLEFTWLDGTAERFVISGFTDNKSTQKLYQLMFSKEYALNGSQLKNVPYTAAVRIKKVSSMNEEEFLSAIRQLGADCGILRPKINENNAFVLFQFLDLKEILALTAIGIAVLLTSILVICSIFYISIMVRIRQFGQLSTLGATTKQIRKMVRLEGLILGLAGSLPGLAVGTLFAVLVRPHGFSLQNTLILWGIVLFANLVTVQLAIRKPAKIAAAVSPLEAAKHSGYALKPSAKNLRKIPAPRRLTPLGLARLSGRRNRSRALMTLLSLSIGGIVFLTASTLMVSTNPEEYSRTGAFRFGEYLLSFSNNAALLHTHGRTDLQMSNPFTPELLSQLQQIEGVDQVHTKEKFSVDFEYKSYSSEDSLSPFGLQDMDMINRLSLEKEPFDYEKLVKNKEILITGNSQAKDLYGWEFEPGDTITFRWFDGTRQVSDTFTIAGELTDLDSDEEGRLLNLFSGWFLIPRDLLVSMMPEGFQFTAFAMVSVTSGRTGLPEAEDRLRAICETNPTLRLDTLEENIQKNQGMFRIVYTTLLAISAFIICFALINLLNTLVSGAMARRQEFAMLRSVGMTTGQLRVMFQAEGILLSLKSLLISLIFGLGCGCGLILALNRIGISYLSCRVPLPLTAGYCMFLFLVPMLISRVILHTLENRSLSHRLRESE